MAGSARRPAGGFGWIARAVSLTLALATAAIVTVAPFALAVRLTPSVHAVTPLILAGMSLAFVHGFGLRSAGRYWRWVFSPWLAWPLLAVGWGLAFLARAAGV